MSGYCHTRQFELRYTDFDFRDELKLSSLLSLVQDVACSSADELGFGYDALKARNLAFITVSTYGELRSSVRLGDLLTVETWPLPPRHVIFERDTRVRNQRGEVVAALASRWCLVDLSEFALRLPQTLGEAHTNCPYNPEKAVETPGWRLPKLCGDGRERYRMVVRNSVCDHYFHANNTRYADFFLDCFSMDELPPLKSFQIVYVKQAKEGSELRFLQKDTDRGALLEAQAEGELIAQCELKFSGDNV